MTDPTTTGSVERRGSFPPVTGADWRNMFLGRATPIDGEAAQVVYDVAWFLVKDVAAASELTAITFRVALSRLHDLPLLHFEGKSFDRIWLHGYFKFIATA